MTTDQVTALGVRIREARQSMPPVGHDTRTSQEALAGRVGVHWVTVSSWERGKYPPTLANLMAIAEATGKPLEFFTAEEEQTAASDDEEKPELFKTLLHLCELLGDLKVAS